MKHYLKVYAALIKLNFSLLLIYRSNFINSAISTVGWGIFQIVWIYFLTSRSNSFYGWSSGELTILAVSYVIVVGIFHFFFSRNFDRFSMLIDYGELDTLLLKPLDPQFFLSCWYINYANVLRILFGLVYIVYMLGSLHVVITLSSVLGYVSLMFFGVLLIYSVWLLFATLMIWHPKLSNIIDFLYNLNGLSRYPPEMLYETRNFILLFLVPISLTIAVPTKALFHKVLSGDVIGLLFFSLMLFFLSRKFWQYALRHYTSASG